MQYIKVLLMVHFTTIEMILTVSVAIKCTRVCIFCMCVCVLHIQLCMYMYLCIYVFIYIDGHESKPAISILAIVQESRKTSAFRYFSTYFFHFIT